MFWTMLGVSLAILGHGPKQVEATRYASHGWVLQIDRERFTGKVSCIARRPRMRLQKALVVFDLGGGADTSDAYYRLDLGPAHSIREVRREVQLAGFFMNRGPVENPSGGKVALPLSQLWGVQRVDIRATLRDQPRTFDLKDLQGLVADARRLGCPG
jgi:hypothetical protein